MPGTQAEQEVKPGTETGFKDGKGLACLELVPAFWQGVGFQKYFLAFSQALLGCKVGVIKCWGVGCILVPDGLCEGDLHGVFLL